MGSRVDLKVRMSTVNVTRNQDNMTFSCEVYGFDQAFKVTKAQVLFSGFDLCDLEKSVNTDMCNTCDVI